MDKETFDRTVDHLSKSLDNAQNTIRFIDTKVGVVASVLSFALGGVFSCTSLPHYFLQLARDVSCPQVLSLLILLLAAAAIVLFALGLRAAWKTLNARAPNAPGRLLHWFLFPICKKDEYQKLYAEFDERLKNGLNGDAIIEEYKDQLVVLSRIQSDKIVFCNRMLSFFGWALFVAVICGGVLFVKQI
jgi:hypothetical protein